MSGSGCQDPNAISELARLRTRPGSVCRAQPWVQSDRDPPLRLDQYPRRDNLQLSDAAILATGAMAAAPNSARACFDCGCELWLRPPENCLPRMPLGHANAQHGIGNVGVDLGGHNAAVAEQALH